MRSRSAASPTDPPFGRRLRGNFTNGRAGGLDLVSGRVRRAPRPSDRRGAAGRPPRGRPGRVRAAGASGTRASSGRSRCARWAIRTTPRTPCRRRCVGLPAGRDVPRRRGGAHLAAPDRRQRLHRPDPARAGAADRAVAGARPPVARVPTRPSSSSPGWRSARRWRMLPVEQRVAVVLVDVQGYPVAEAAAILEVPVGTVKSRCARGRARLARAARAPEGGERMNASGRPIPDVPAHGLAALDADLPDAAAAAGAAPQRGRPAGGGGARRPRGDPRGPGRPPGVRRCPPGGGARGGAGRRLGGATRRRSAPAPPDRPRSGGPAPRSRAAASGVVRRLAAGRRRRRSVVRSAPRVRGRPCSPSAGSTSSPSRPRRSAPSTSAISPIPTAGRPACAPSRPTPRACGCSGAAAWSSTDVPGVLLVLATGTRGGLRRRHRRPGLRARRRNPARAGDGRLTSRK